MIHIHNRRTIVIASHIATILLVCALAWGDTVYLQDGRKLTGTITEGGGKVTVTNDEGTTTVPIEQVVHIDRDEPVTTVPDDSGDPADVGEGDATPPPSTDDAPADTPPIMPAVTVFNMEKAIHPDSVVYMLMRRLKTMEAGTNTYELRKQIDHWRASAHDRQRRVRGKWLRPGDFTRRRRMFKKRLAKAADHAAELNSIKDTDPHAERDRQKYRTKLRLAMREAARTWCDEHIENYLMGIAFYESGAYTQAADSFQKASDANPLISGFHQAKGLALMRMGTRQVDALAAFMAELRLRPDDSAVVYDVAQAMEKVPGVKTKEELFTKAKELIETYPAQWREKKSTKSRGMVWRMPSERGWTVRNGTLPQPTYDRLAMKQAVAAPVDESVLLVDAAVVTGALQVFVRIDDSTITPAYLPQSRRSSSDEGSTAVALISVPHVTFEPLAVDPDAEFHEGDIVTAYGLSVLPEMGTVVRSLRTSLVPREDGLTPKMSLAAGESSSPVVTTDLRLVGMLDRRTDVLAEQGGEGAFIPRTQFDDVLAKRSRLRYRSSFGRRSRRKITPRPAKGTHFVVYGIFGETLD
ncbi:MAG: tetratricopeptide repeat protein [Planctomycetota bacterium]|jgi:tetratricopeptide (TPR) repeat protein